MRRQLGSEALKNFLTFPVSVKGGGKEVTTYLCWKDATCFPNRLSVKTQDISPIVPRVLPPPLRGLTQTGRGFSSQRNFRRAIPDERKTGLVLSIYY